MRKDWDGTVCSPYENGWKIKAQASLDENVNVNQKPRTVNHFFVEMVSFHELQELFLFSYAPGLLDDGELLLLYEEYSPKNPDFAKRIFLWTV